MAKVGSHITMPCPLCAEELPVPIRVVDVVGRTVELGLDRRPAEEHLRACAATAEGHAALVAL